MKINRRKSKIIKVGDICIGGNNPIAIQSMTKVKTSEVEATVRQIKGLVAAGAEVIRLAIKDTRDAKALRAIKQRVKVPLVADIHFDWRLALESIDNGADKIRLNPGNIYKKEQVRQIAVAARQSRIPIRVGLNSGSLTKFKIQNSKVKSAPEIMVESALEYIKILEKSGFYDIVVSLKASDIFDTIRAYRKMAGACDYPLHLGVTATGNPLSGLVKSSMALSVLLLEGIGDTIRVSLTDDPKEEVRAARSILEAMGLRSFGPQIISCPTCGRCEVDLINIVKTLEEKLLKIDSKLWTRPIKLAVMGCVVNGPGEATDADIGVAFGKKQGLLFKKGKPIRKIAPDDCVEVLFKELLRK